jgi:protoporphyrinogen oxidase
MQCKWLGERVPAPKLAQAVRSVVYNTEAEAWGPNAYFRYPARNGTGDIWNKFADLIPSTQKILGENGEVVTVDLEHQQIHFSNGARIRFNNLISTIPVKELGKMSSDSKLQTLTSRLRSSSTHVVGIGLRGQPPKEFRDTYWVGLSECLSQRTYL